MIQNNIAMSRVEIDQARLMTLQAARCIDRMGTKRARKQVNMMQAFIISYSFALFSRQVLYLVTRLATSRLTRSQDCARHDKAKRERASVVLRASRLAASLVSNVPQTYLPTYVHIDPPTLTYLYTVLTCPPT